MSKKTFFRVKKNFSPKKKKIFLMCYNMDKFFFCDLERFIKFVNVNSYFKLQYFFPPQFLSLSFNIYVYI